MQNQLKRFDFLQQDTAQFKEAYMITLLNQDPNCSI